MKDNVKARDMQPDGTYIRLPASEPLVDAQSRLFAEAYANVLKSKPVPKPEPKAEPVPEPVTQPVQAQTEVRENTENVQTQTNVEEKPEPVQNETPVEEPVKKKVFGQGSSRYSVVKVKVKKKK